MLLRYGDEVETDFLRFYPQLDLLDLWRGTLSLRRVFILVEGLRRREDSDLAMAINGGIRPLTRDQRIAADIWTQAGKARWGKKAADAHPVVSALIKRQKSRRRQDRKARLANAQQRHEQRRRLRGRGRRQ